MRVSVLEAMPASPPPSSHTESQLGETRTDTGDRVTGNGVYRDEGQAIATSGASVGADMQPVRSVVKLHGMQRRSTCGYCKTVDGSGCYAMDATRLSCQNYQDMIDRGWRRSGGLLYLTDHSDSCCCYYPIRTLALEFKPGSSDKRVLRKWKRRFGAACIDSLLSDAAGAFDERQLSIAIDSAEYSDEKYRVFEKYQRVVHNEHDTTQQAFFEFLCTGPLVHCRQDVPQDAEHLRELLPRGFGSYHMCYYIDGTLVAVGVIDILPRCVSSVYLFYDPDYSDLSLGSFSAMREISLVRQLHLHIPSIKHYYPGYYIPGCSKMTYKSRWRPAELLDLVSFKWVPIGRCLQRIADYPGFCTFDPDLDTRNIVRKQGETMKDAALALYSPKQVLDNDTNGLVVWLVMNGGGRRVRPLLVSDLATVSTMYENMALQAYAAMGRDLAKSMILLL
ncbi:Arginyl-tRNA--protein transferase 1 [Coemansia sp. IMI 203386]|nr:Arginyl-tRNA--protein transferase 1 [Coemansia sp. IMI 203386]